jgi:SSS family solute:Na+ symporter
MQVGWWLFCMCSVIYVIVSLLTPKPGEEELENLCWKRPLKAITQGRLKGVLDPRVMAAILFVTMIILYAILH